MADIWKPACAAACGVVVFVCGCMTPAPVASVAAPSPAVTAEAAVPTHFWQTQPLAGCYGFTWTMTSRIGDMLKEAEAMLGPRDRAWTILGAEIRTDPQATPQNWYPGYPQRKDIVFQVVPAADRDRAEAVFQLAHEVVHALAPMPGGGANVLEEGVAAWFAADYTKKAKGVDIHSSLPSYQDAHAKVGKLLDRDREAILKLRKIEPAFGKITPETFTAAGLDIPADEIAALLAPFNRTAAPAP